jgi:hypothetical protein
MSIFEFILLDAAFLAIWVVCCLVLERVKDIQDQLLTIERDSYQSERRPAEQTRTRLLPFRRS